MRKKSPSSRLTMLAIIGGLSLFADSLAAAATPSYIQGNSATPQNPQQSVSVGFNGAQQAGHLNVVIVGWGNGAAVTSVTDQTGNVYKLAVGPMTLGLSSQSIYYCAGIAAAAGNGVTVSFNEPAVFPDIRIAEYSGIDPNQPLDRATGSSGSNATTATGSMTTTSPADLLVAANYVQTTTITGDPAFTTRVITYPDSDIVEDRVVTATGSYSASAQLNVGGSWVMQLVAFRANTGNGSTVADTQPPTVPASVSATAQSSAQASVTWSASADNVGVSGYVLQRCQGQGCTAFVTIASPAGVSYTDPGLRASTTYNYRVAARDSAGNQSGYSETAAMTTTASAATGSAPIKYVQGTYSTPQAPQATVNVTYPGAQTAGDLNVVAIGWGDTSSSIQSVVDSHGNAYRPAVGPTAQPGFGTQVIYFAPNIAAAASGTNTVTVKFSAAVTFPDIRAIEYTGIDAGTPVDSVSQATGNSAQSSAGTVVTQNPSDLLVSANYVQTTTTAAGPGYAARMITNPDSDILEDRVVTTAGSYTAQAALNVAGIWVGQIVAFRAAAGTGSSGTSAPVYPLAASSNHRYLVDQNGTPVLLVGDGSAQTLVQRVPSVVTTYLDDRETYGFNALWMHVITNNLIGGNANGVTDDNIAPFTGTISSGSCDTGPCYDLTTPNAAYFARVDQIVNIAAAHGMVVFLDMLDNDSYLQLYEANGDTRVTAFARYLVNRYKSFPNIVWMTGNDFQTWNTSSTDNQLALDITSTIAGSDASHLQTTELNFNISGSLDDSLLVPYTSLAAAYTYYPAYYEVLQEYNSRARTVPVYLIESYYEGTSYGNLNPNQANDLVLRKVPYWTVLAGGLGGYFYGSNYYTFPPGWQSGIDTPAVTQLGYWKALFGSLPSWYNLVPDQNHTIVTAGYGTPSGNGTGNIQTDAYVTTAGTPDGKLVMAYLPARTTIAVNMTKLSGTVTAQWFDPTNGTYITISGSPFPATGTRNFTSPGNNSTGDPDWVLVLQVK